MAFDAFIKIDGIEGESSDDRHTGWIEVIRYGWGIKQKASWTASSVGGGSSERADFSDFRFRKLLDRSTPNLVLSCASGDHIDKIVVELCRAGAEKIKFVTYMLSNCLISRVVTNSGSDVKGQFSAETVDINFGIFEWSYHQQARKGGGLVGNIAAGWDLQRNCKV